MYLNGIKTVVVKFSNYSGAMKNILSLPQTLGLFVNTFKYLQKTKLVNANIEDLKMQWGQDMISRLNVDLEVVGDISQDKSVIFFGNHISYLDIPLLMSRVRGLSFVAKEEVGSLPIIGTAAKKVETVFVKRDSGASRKQARQSIQTALGQGKRVAIFPSGTTCIHENKPWKKGAFEIAHEQNFLLQPFRLTYTPLRAVAYIDDDFLPTHLGNLFFHKNIKAKLEFHEPIKVSDPIADCNHWQAWSKGLIKANTA